MEKFIKRIAIAILTGILAFAVIPATVQAAGWKQNKNGYWWQENDYSYPRNQWKTIYGKQYHFNSSGYMDTGWKKIDGKWYYLGGKNDGAKKTYWQKVYGKYYWLGNDGEMRTGWQKVYNKYYWLGSSNDGAMKTGWQKVYGKYYWLGHSNDGAMKTGWQTVYGKKYYLGGANDGAMKTGWQKIDGYWYYFGAANDGSLKTNTWIDGYYVDVSGRRQEKTELKSYFDDWSSMYAVLGGNIEISNNGSMWITWAEEVCYIRNHSDVKVQWVESVSSEYSIWGTFAGQSVSSASSVLVNQGWSLEKIYKDGSVEEARDYVKGQMKICLLSNENKIWCIQWTRNRLDYQSIEDEEQNVVIDGMEQEIEYSQGDEKLSDGNGVEDVQNEKQVTEENEDSEADFELDESENNEKSSGENNQNLGNSIQESVTESVTQESEEMIEE